MFFIYNKKHDRVYIKSENLDLNQIIHFMQETENESDLITISNEITSDEILYGQDEEFYKKLAAVKLLDTITVEGRSMVPLFIPNDLIKIDANITGIVVGKIIIFYQNERLVIHRIVKILENNCIITKGDNCTEEDTPISYNAIIGTVKGIKTSIRQRIKWGVYYIKKRKYRKGFGVLISWMKRIK